MLALTGHTPFWSIFELLSAHTVATGVFDPAAGSIPPRLAPREQLGGTNSLMALISQLGIVVGVLPAGLVVATLGAAAAFGINAVSFADAVLAAIGPTSVGLPLIARDVLQSGAEGYSLLLWSSGLGSGWG